LKPLPTQAGVLYWLDKVLGGALGFAQASLLVLVALFAATALPLGRAGAAVRASGAFTLFSTDVEPQLHDVPEVKVVRSIGDLARLADDVKERPERLDVVRRSAAFDGIRGYKP